MPADTLTPGAGSLVPLPYRVARRHTETSDVFTLDLEPAATGIAEPSPGQFAMLYAFGVGEVPISVSGCPADDGVLRHTIRSAGAVTGALSALAPGTPVGVRGPFGAGWPLASAAGLDLLLVGGGIGLAPLRPVVRRALAGHDRFGRVGVLIGARTPGDLLFPGELDRWQASDLSVEVTVDAAPGGWRGDVGVVTGPLRRMPIEPGRTIAMVCGPEVMMRVVALQLVDSGMDPGRIHLSLERNMQCAVGHCGHCQLGPMFVCTDGPVVPWSVAEPLMAVRRW